MMTQHTILLVAGDPAATRVLPAVLSNAGYEVRTAQTGEQALQMIAVSKPELVVLDLTLPDIDGVHLCEILRTNHPATHLGIIVLLERQRLNEVATVFKAGADDFVLKERGADQELLKKCAALLDHDHKTTPRSAGRLVSFFSAKGGLGTSVLCLNIAHCLSEQVAPKTVLVADMVLPLGSIGLMVGAPPGNSVAGLTTEQRRFNIELIKEYIVKSENWNCAVLQGPITPDEAHSLDVNRIEPVFAALRTMFDYTLVDFGRTLSRISQPLLSHSDCIVMILGPDQVSVHLTSAAVEHLVALGINKNKLFPVLNRAVGREGLTKTEIEKTLGLEIAGTIPYAQDNFTLAINQTFPYLKRFPRDATADMLKQLASRLVQQIEKNAA